MSCRCHLQAVSPPGKAPSLSGSPPKIPATARLLGDTDARERFRSLPTNEILAALDTLYDLHAALDAGGWVEGDFYDSSLMYDFSTHRLTVFDLDSYHRGPTATRWVARAAQILLPEPPPQVNAVLVEATTTRFPGFREFHEAWLTASSMTDVSVSNRAT